MISKKTLGICLVLYFLSQILFLVNIQFPRGYNFDEFHYVPSAKQFLEMKPNQNWEHPPLGKELMAVGIAIGQDRPFGWRLMSTFFGSLTLLGMFFWALAVFRDERVALWVAGLTLVNQLLYVQARIGMLDTFMFAFVVWGLAAFSAAWDPTLPRQKVLRLWLFTGLMFGLGTACKWSAVVCWAALIACVLLVRLLQTWGTRFHQASTGDWYHPDLWKGVRWPQWVLALIVVPLAAYLATFIPLLFVPGQHEPFFTELFAMQKRMYEGQLRVVSSHPYMSHWTDWAILKRPIWYAFDREGNEQDWVRGVVLLGNPLVMWSGLVAMLACLWGWLAGRARDAFLIVLAYSVFYFSWIVIPRKISFYYYYYPAGMTLSLALAYAFHHYDRGRAWLRMAFLGIALGIFIYFFPILAALRINADSFRRWMWFTSWV